MAEFINKRALVEAITTELEALVQNAKDATLRAYESATHEENVPENKYDTLALEAAYLTQGQARRLAECEADLEAFKNLKVVDFGEGDPIALGAFVHLQDAGGVEQRLLLGPGAGGLKIQFQNQLVVVITPSAPLGKALLNVYEGDDVEIGSGISKKRFSVISIQ